MLSAVVADAIDPCGDPTAQNRMLVAKQHAIHIVHTLRQSGFQAYLCGGCVRDLLLERQPADYDVTTDATPDQVMRIFPETYAVGAQFGVVLVPIPQDDRSPDEAAISPPEDTVASSSLPFAKADVVEVATFRSDVSYTDGRHPDVVRFSKSPREDVERRDFTINGLLLDPATNQVLDYVGGQKDLQAKIIRTIGDPELRFAEDKLRMLRAVRFAARFGFRIEPATMAAIQRLAPQVAPD